MESEWLDEITVDGKIYIDKRQLMALIREEKQKNLQGTEKGYIRKEEGQRIAAMLALNHLAAIINKKYYDTVVHPRINSHLIVTTGPECFLYFKGWCYHVPGREGKPTPTFSEDPNDAVTFADLDQCECTASSITREFPQTKVNHCCANFPWQKYGLRNMHAMYGWPKGKDPDEVLEREMFYTKVLS